MGWMTYYKCDRVEFTTTQIASDRPPMTSDAWQAARVYLSESSNILVTVGGDERNPVMWHAIEDAWSTNCDEASLTLLLQNTDGPEKCDKLRFMKGHDFWSFVAHYAYSRVHAYANHWESMGYSGSSDVQVASSGGSIA
ncbi:hypothetical protein VTO73DRAFT_6064 [Trametes versicolor]